MAMLYGQYTSDSCGFLLYLHCYGGYQYKLQCKKQILAVNWYINIILFKEIYGYKL